MTYSLQASQPYPLIDGQNPMPRKDRGPAWRESRGRLAGWREIIGRTRADTRRVSAALIHARLDFDDVVRGFLRGVSFSARGPLAEAFKYFGLDPQNPTHREYLLAILAEAAFGEPHPRGRPKDSKHWHSARLHLLALQYEAVLAEEPGLNDRAAAKKIKQRYYKGQQVGEETIRQRLPTARRQIAQVRRWFEK